MDIKAKQELSGKELVLYITASSKALDSMRDEVDLVVKTLLGLLQVPYKDRGFVILSYSNASIRWVFISGSPLSALCKFIQTEKDYAVKNLYSSEIGASSIPLPFVQSVYDSLGELIKYTLRKFPYLLYQLQPFFEVVDETNDNQKSQHKDKQKVKKVLTENRKSRAVMQIIARITSRHYSGVVSLDEPIFELLELARRIYQAKNEREFQLVLTELANFNK